MGHQDNNSGNLRAGKRYQWADLPDNMKLVVVRELTTWVPYHKAIGILGLSQDDEAAFCDIYNAEVDRLTTREADNKAYMKQQDARLLTGYPDRMYLSANDKPLTELIMPAGGRDLITHCITMEQMKVGQAFLRGLGLARQAAEMSHWVGHSTDSSFQFQIEKLDVFDNPPGDQEAREAPEGHENIVLRQRLRAVNQTIAMISTPELHLALDPPPGTINPRRLLRNWVQSDATGGPWEPGHRAGPRRAEGSAQRNLGNALHTAIPSALLASPTGPAPLPSSTLGGDMSAVVTASSLGLTGANRGGVAVVASGSKEGPTTAARGTNEKGPTAAASPPVTVPSLVEEMLAKHRSYLDKLEEKERAEGRLGQLDDLLGSASAAARPRATPQKRTTERQTAYADDDEDDRPDDEEWVPRRPRPESRKRMRAVVNTGAVNPNSATSGGSRGEMPPQPAQPAQQQQQEPKPKRAYTRRKPAATAPPPKRPRATKANRAGSGGPAPHSQGLPSNQAAAEESGTPQWQPDALMMQVMATKAHMLGLGQHIIPDAIKLASTNEAWRKHPTRVLEMAFQKHLVEYMNRQVPSTGPTMEWKLSTLARVLAMTPASVDMAKVQAPGAEDSWLYEQWLSHHRKELEVECVRRGYLRDPRALVPVPAPEMAPAAAQPSLKVQQSPPVPAAVPTADPTAAPTAALAAAPVAAPTAVGAEAAEAEAPVRAPSAIQAGLGATNDAPPGTDTREWPIGTEIRELLLQKLAILGLPSSEIERAVEETKDGKGDLITWPESTYLRLVRDAFLENEATEEDRRGELYWEKVRMLNIDRQIAETGLVECGQTGMDPLRWLEAVFRADFADKFRGDIQGQLDHKPDSQLIGDPQEKQVHQPDDQRVGETPKQQVRQPDGQRVGDPQEQLDHKPDGQLVGETQEQKVHQPDDQRAGEIQEQKVHKPEDQLVGEIQGQQVHQPDDQRVGGLQEQQDDKPDSQQVGGLQEQQDDKSDSQQVACVTTEQALREPDQK